MAAVTTVPGRWSGALPPSPPGAWRVATPRRRRTSPTVRRRRAVVAVLALGIVVVAGQAGGALGSSPLGAPERRPTSAVETIVVRPGDTLWGIAERVAPHEDPRPIVDDLTAVRGSGPLTPGETIRWPR